MSPPRPLAPTWLPFLAAALLLPACNTERGGSRRGGGDDDDSSIGADDDDTSDDDDDDSVEPCTEVGNTTCLGSLFMECDGDAWQVTETCAAPTPLCDPDIGCHYCEVGNTFCEDGNAVECLGDGATTAVVDFCEDNESCVAGECRDACDNAESQYSYLGCSFLAVTAVNPLDPTFDGNFGVVIGNPGGAGTADVTIRRGGLTVATASVPENQTAAITLPMVNELQDVFESSVVPGAAYEVQTSVPVAAYQYSPLDFEIFGVNSFSNDASLLLPEHILTGNYMVSSHPSFGVAIPAGSWNIFYGGFTTVAATTNGTVVTITSSGNTAAGNPGNLGPGDVTQVTLNRGDVLQLLSEIPAASSDYNYCSNNGWLQVDDPTCGNTGQSCSYCQVITGDLTGTRISATAPVAVLAGHQCTFMPVDSWACDHLEESMFPLETWGTSVVMTAPTHPDGVGVATTRYRVLASLDGTLVSFEPAVHTDVTLDAGQFLEFDSDQDFQVSASSRIYVSQTMHSQQAVGGDMGDPAMGSGIPWVQVRSSYDFLTPSTYTANYVNVVAPSGASVELDSVPVSGWSPIAGTGFDVARLPIGAGSHRMSSSSGQGFGITTYGYASYTSYLYPGGLNFLR